MLNSRVWCAAALLCSVACSFPDFRVPGAPDATRNCTDGAQNADESGVDCGGGCKPCPTCDDGQQNGSESDTDCGGTCDARCDTDQRCREGADCASFVCDGVCQPSNCRDKVRNGGETGLDCGGSCDGCANGSACKSNSDCADRRCQTEVCVSAACTDGVVNGVESDLDCGGEECAPCAANGKCNTDEDCDSRVCSERGACNGASCNDATQNQGESAVDCGGESCAPCAIGKSCSVPPDCETELCQNGTCVPENPSGQPLSRAKWLLRSSETTTETGATSAFDGSDTSSWTSGKAQYSGMYVELDLGQPQIFFKLLLKVTQAPHDQDFPGNLEVYVSNDGNYGAPSMTDVMGNQWTWIDFQSAQVARYVRLVVTRPKTATWSIGELEIYD